jgi:D-3-phosphoglycerate dehydrogenase / 2-oxoglutarate reductase
VTKVLQALSTFAENGPEPREILEAAGCEVVYNPYGRRLKREEIVELGSSCEGVLAGVEPYDAWVLGQMPSLRVISRAGVGTDSIDKALAAERSIVVRNTPDVVVAPVAELTLAVTLDLLKRVTWHTERLKSRDWRKATGHMLQGSCVAVVGLGSIGRRVAEVMSTLGARVLGVDPAPRADWATEHGFRLVDLTEALRVADVVTLHLTSDTFLMGATEIALMKPGALLLNFARGGYVDEGALFDGIQSGHLGGAGLDVFPEEPYGGRLCDLDNVVLTPHIATLTVESRLAMEVECVRNLVEELGR